MALAFLGVASRSTARRPARRFWAICSRSSPARLGRDHGHAEGDAAGSSIRSRTCSIKPLRQLLSALHAYAAGESCPRISLPSALSVVYQSVMGGRHHLSVLVLALKAYHAGELSAFTFITPVFGVFAGSVSSASP